MNRWIVRTLWAAAALGVMGAATLGVGVQLGERKLERIVEVPKRTVALPGDAASLERGRYLFTTRGCSECHGPDGAGHVFIDSDSLRIRSPNITAGPGSVVATYQVADWERALRHGVKQSGRPLFVMPSEDYARLTDADLGALVAYAKQLPPMAGGAMQAELPLLVRALYGYGVVRDAAEKIDHTLAPALPVAEAETPAWGEYVANACLGCHGPTLEGGPIAGAPPHWPPAANLRAGGALGAYPSADAFVAAMRSARRPDGSTISDVMPFESLGAMNDTDLRAMFSYFKTLPSAPKR